MKRDPNYVFLGMNLRISEKKYASDGNKTEVWDTQTLQAVFKKKNTN